MFSQEVEYDMPTGFSVFGNMPVVQVAATVRELTQQNGVRSSPRPSGAVETIHSLKPAEDLLLFTSTNCV